VQFHIEAAVQYCPVRYTNARKFMLEVQGKSHWHDRGPKLRHRKDENIFNSVFKNLMEPTNFNPPK
jgi:hypothetical protein